MRRLAASMTYGYLPSPPLARKRPTSQIHSAPRLLQGIPRNTSMQTSETEQPTEAAKPISKPLRKPTERKLTLYSCMPAQGVLSQLDAGFIINPSDRTTLLTQWEKASREYNKQANGFRSFVSEEDIRPIETVSSAKKEALLKRIKVYPPYDSHSTQLCNVRIDKLVTPQLTINESRAEKRAKIKPNMSEEELFDVAFNSAGQPEPITRQILGMAPNGGAVLFTSYDEDIRLHHPPQFRNLPINEKDPESPSLESVCHPIGGGLPFASAFRVEVLPGSSRIILNNGIHRVFRLAGAGYEWCPMLVTDLLPLEFPDPFVELPRDFLLAQNSSGNYR